MAQPLCKTVWPFPTKLNILVTYNLAVVFLGIYPDELKSPCKNLHTSGYSSFIPNCQNLEAPKLSPVGEWRNKAWSTQTAD